MNDALHDALQNAGAQEFLPYGPQGAQVAMPESFGAYEAEYAAVRRHVAILHRPQAGLLRVTGADRQDFLHRMVTQNIASMTGGQTRRAMQLNGKGRIVADMRVHHGDVDGWLEMDRFDVAPLREILEARLFTEDVTLEDVSDEWTALSLHGPAALPLIEALSDRPPLRELTEEGIHQVLSLAGQNVTAYRWDSAGSLGLHLWVRSDAAAMLYGRLLEAADYEADAEVDAELAQRRRQGLRGRPIGWLAYNTARIEAGTAIFHIDFGPDSLPAETGLLDEAVSFNKGCYLGQEIVARMKNLGHPKRVLAGLRFPEAGPEDLPVAGTQVFEPTESGQVPTQMVGGITSSTLSPLLGHAPIALAVLKWGRHRAGTSLTVPCEGRMLQAVVQERLAFI